MLADTPDVQSLKDRRLLMSALIFANLVGLLASMLVIGFAASNDPALAAQVTREIRHAVRMYVAGAFVPILPMVFFWIHLEVQLAWSQRILKWGANIFLFISGLLFVLAGWSLPHGLLRGFVGR